MPAPAPLTAHVLARSGLVLTGLLLLAVGFGNMVAGESKISQYGDVLRATPVRAPADPAALFPPASEGAERQRILRAKLAFYQLLVTAGQLLCALGCTLIAFGILRLWLRAARPPADVPLSH